MPDQRYVPTPERLRLARQRRALRDANRVIVSLQAQYELMYQQREAAYRSAWEARRVTRHCAWCRFKYRVKVWRITGWRWVVARRARLYGWARSAMSEWFLSASKKDLFLTNWAVAQTGCDDVEVSRTRNARACCDVIAARVGDVTVYRCVSDLGRELDGGDEPMVLDREATVAAARAAILRASRRKQVRSDE